MEKKMMQPRRLGLQMKSNRILSNYSFPGLKATRRPELVRDFIQDCLYNPEYGYFQRNVNIFQHSTSALDFSRIKDQEHYTNTLYQLYRDQTKSMKFYQLWHTPSELFRPWYAKGIANYLLEKHRDGQPLVIYEVGPGNGTLCKDIMDHLKKYHPNIFVNMEYHLIEISKYLVDGKLHEIQKMHPRQVRIHNKSFFDWDTTETRPCHLLAMEMFDNLPQDRIRFTADGTLEQGMVVTNDESRYFEEQRRYEEVWTIAKDPLIIELVHAMDAVEYKWQCLRWSWTEPLISLWPLNVFRFERPWRKEFIPTGPYMFFKVLKQHFPCHTFLMTDFDTLPEAIPGAGSPIVQTRYEGDTVACSTYLLQRGLFDIFFPVNFGLLSGLYKHIINAGSTTIIKHADFCKRYTDHQKTETKSGFNPMLNDFKNVSFLLTEKNIK